MTELLDLNKVTSDPAALDLNLVQNTNTPDRTKDTSSLLNLELVETISPATYFKQRERNILGDVSAQFGGETKPFRTTRQLSRAFWRNAGFTDVTDFERLYQDLQDLRTDEPELAASPEGQVYQDKMHKRIRSVMDAEEIDIVNTFKTLGKAIYDAPTDMIELIGEAFVEDPLLPLMFAGAYYTGGRSAHAAAEIGGLSNLIHKLSTGSTAARQAAISLEGAVEVLGVMGAEGGLGYLYEVAQNQAIGRDPIHNAKQIAAMGAVLGGGIKGLDTAFKLIKGYPGRYATKAEALESMADSGFNVPEIIRASTELFDDLPKASQDELAAWAKMHNIEVPPFTVRERHAGVDQDVKTVVSALEKEYVDPDLPGNLGVSKIYSNTGIDQPSGTTVKGGVYYNLDQIKADFDNKFGFLRGETKEGKKGTGRPAQTRSEAFKEFDFKEFEKWLNRREERGKAKGVSKYAEFLMRMEANKLRYGRMKNPGVNVYKRAINDALLEMGADPRRFSRRATVRATLAKEAGFNYVRRTAQEVRSNPRLLYEPIKDILIGTKQFATDVLKGPAEGAIAYAKARRELSNMLRDWEGGRMAGELPLNDFANYVKGYLKKQDKLEAMSHYMEGNLEAYQKYRQTMGLAPVELTLKDMEVAPAIRKFFDDMVEWTQRSELFNEFRQNNRLYSAARNYTDRTRGVDHARGKKPTALDKEMWDYIQRLEDPFDVAEQITPIQKRGTEQSRRLPTRENYVPHVTRREFAPSDDTSIFADVLADAHRAQQLQTRSRFTRRREHDTLLDAIHAGETLLTQDISQLIKMYGKSMLRSQINHRLLSQLRKTKSAATGKPMVGTKDEVPHYYVEFKHPNFMDRNDNYLYVNPNMAPDLRLYFDTNNPNIANRMLQNIILISKRSSLGLSLFHMMALAWSGLATGQSPIQVLKNVLPMGNRFRSIGLQALAGEEGYEVLLLGMRNGLGIGVLEELKGDTLINAIRRVGNTTEKMLAGNRYLKPIGKTGRMGFHGLARAQEIIDTHLWDHINTGLKATTFLTTFEKMVLNDARRAQKLGINPSDRNLLAQRAAQYTNDAYGNQNWNQMAMNVDNHMGHRFAAALNKPSMRGYIRMLVFAPDWTLSNARVIMKAPFGMYGKTKLPGANYVKDLATPEYMAYSLRSAMLFAFIGEALQQSMGQGSIFDDDIKDALRPDLGDGKEMEISKQLTEVIRMMPWVYGPAYVLSHKLGTLPVVLASDDPLGEFLQRSVPISMQQKSISGALGVPIYGE